MPDSLQKITIATGPGARRHTVAVVLLAAGLLLGCMAAAVAVDPRGEFHTGRFRPLVLDVPSEKLLLAREAAPIGALVVGSSRAMPLPPDALPEGRGFNFALLGGSLRDDALAYAAAARLGGPPQRLVVALDSFQLMQLPDGGRWSVVLDSPAAPGYLGEEVPWTARLGALPGTLSAGYARDTATVLAYTFVAGYPEPANAFRADGLGLRPRADAAIANGTYGLRAAFEENWERYLGRIYAADARADPAAPGELERLARQARGDGAEVDVVLPPFWHGALERLEPNPVFQDFQQRALQAAVELCPLGVRVFDYTRAEAFAGLVDGFYDGYHVTPANGARLLEAVAQGRGDLCPQQP